MIKIVFSLLLSIVLLNGKLSAQQKTRDGYYNNTKLSAQYVLGETFGGIALATVNGFHFTENISAGVGVAFSHYRDAYYTIPVFLQANYFIKESVNSPYVYANAGYAIGIEGNNTGGFVGETGLGWQFKIGNMSLGPELSYKYITYNFDKHLIAYNNFTIGLSAFF